MLRNEGRAPRPFFPMILVGIALLGLFSVAALAWYGHDLVDTFGYQRIYSRLESDGRRFQLERKRIFWLPGPDCRCVVSASDGTREVMSADSCDEEDSPEQRIRAAMRREE